MKHLEHFPFEYSSGSASEQASHTVDCIVSSGSLCRYTVLKMEPPEGTSKIMCVQDKDETSKAEFYGNSLRVRFARQDVDPEDYEIFDFMNGKMDLKSDDLLAMYKERSTTMSVIIKFKLKKDLFNTLRKLPSEMIFGTYPTEEMVTLSVAGSVYIRYIQLFNLPPEITDSEIAKVLSQYGKIHLMIRECYDSAKFPLWTSVRGVYIEGRKEGNEIPQCITIRNVIARVYDEGKINSNYNVKDYNIISCIDHQ